MASIIKRRQNYCVVYRFEDENGNKKQKWETLNTHAEALKRKHEIEHQQDSGSFVPPSEFTVKDLITQFMELYGEVSWAFKTYVGYESKARNYIYPYIGDVPLRKVTPLLLDEYYKRLQEETAVGRKGQSAKNKVSAKTIQETHKLLRAAFNKAVAWDLVTKNPCDKATTPQYEPKEKAILKADDILRTITICKDKNLQVALSLGFSCTLRIGEILGLTWDCVDISMDSIQNNRCSLVVKKELQRVEVKMIEKLKKNEILFIFPNITHKSASRLLLKTPKTKTSVRRVGIPRTLALMLLSLKRDQEEKKELLGTDYYSDFNMVIAGDNGWPIEYRRINKAMHTLLEENDIPKVVFHSLKHSSTSVKLKITHGDIKAVQHDNGHATSAMTLDRYAHAFEDDSFETARLFEDNVFSKLSLPEMSINNDIIEEAVISQIKHMSIRADEQNGGTVLEPSEVVQELIAKTIAQVMSAMGVSC